MAEILVNSQSPITHQVFWNGEVGSANVNPVVLIYDITEDPAINPALSPNQLLATITSSVDENNPGTYFIYIPYQFTDRNRTLRIKWEYAIGTTLVEKFDEVFVVTPYVDFNHIQDLGFSIDPSDPNYKSYKELMRAERYARKQIEQFTAQKFYLYDDLYLVRGYDSDTLPLPSKVYELHELYANDILLYDKFKGINNWNYTTIISESGYGIRIDRSAMLDNTVYTANGMVPPTINDSYGVFQSGVSYKVQGRFGWEKVPDKVELAAVELMKDYFSKDSAWRNRYIKSISTFDWDFEYFGQSYAGTGNLYADGLLQEYVMVSKVEII